MKKAIIKQIISYGFRVYMGKGCDWLIYTDRDKVAYFEHKDGCGFNIYTKHIAISGIGGMFRMHTRLSRISKSLLLDGFDDGPDLADGSKVHKYEGIDALKRVDEFYSGLVEVNMQKKSRRRLTLMNEPC